MTAAPAQTYWRTKVLTASPAQLRLMLLDGAIRFAQQARDGLLNKDYESTYEGVTRCQNILMELISSLRPEHDQALCDRLAGLYTFMYTRLMTASTQRKPEIVDEVLSLLKYDRDTWRLLLDQLAKENAAAGAIDGRPQASPASPPQHPVNAAIIGGTVSLKG